MTNDCETPRGRRCLWGDRNDAVNTTVHEEMICESKEKGSIMGDVIPEEKFH